MSCFDTVQVRCPRCDTLNEAQSKAGDCQMRTYNLNNCPVDILISLESRVISCDACSTEFEIKMQIFTKAWTEAV